MALPPTDAYFYFDEPTSDFRGQLYNRGIPRSNITYECSPHFSHQAKVTRYTIIDATRPNKFTEAEEIIDDDGELIILKVCEEDGETYLEPIEDDNEFNEIGKIFEERLSEMFSFDEE